ncbi:hypothetical protein SLEP1_g3882 [Rubroshorea leprosula]|uniref:Reverse transcriptase domain-containing protein n=1 Tax=Rubroshorea leprosula TaxID=152421 RepID=A0AAV5HVL6_9ROSI|nr:hypothetical protein SLEP1_g3882 [Rubroshorea leprosula]
MEEQGERPKLEGVCFKQVQPEDNRQLIEAFTADEIKAAIWECDSSKALGPNGFNFRFVKSEWEVIKEDVIDFLQEFHKNSKMVRGLNYSFIVLVPKVDNLQKIEEYKPISLIGVIYKILAKILANRLKKVLDELIGKQQMSFISGRQLMDGVVIANELVDEAKKRKKSSFMFKIDFEKAYDKILFGSATDENVWAMKGILRAFELCSGLKINFHKSQLLGGNRINWVKWVEVCKDKERGGLGVKDLGKLNFALLGKWWGRLVSEERGLWKKVICEKYGIKGEHSCNWLRVGFNFGSMWWRDTCRLDSIVEEKQGWLANGFKIKVGGGDLVKFWWDIWSEGESIANKFPRLYSLSTGKDNKISQMGEWVHGTGNYIGGGACIVGKNNKKKNCRGSFKEPQS